MQIIFATFLSFILFLTFSSNSVLGAALVVPEDLFKGYAISPMHFVGRFDGLPGVTVTANGTLEQIIAQVRAHHPDWKPSLVHPNDRHGPPADGVSSAPPNLCGPPVDDNSLVTRHDGLDQDLESRYKTYHECYPVASHPEWHRATSNWAYEAIRLLQRAAGVVFVPARQCVKISCLGDAGIYICNDNDYQISPDIQYITTYAVDIYDWCLQDWNGSSGKLCGVQYDSDKYYVVILWQFCA